MEKSPLTAQSALSSSATDGQSPESVLILGYGYVGREVEKLAGAAGHSVYVTTRSRENADRLAAQGLRPVVADWNDSRTLNALPAVDRVLVAVSYDATSGVDRFESQVGGLARLLDRLPRRAAICYLSTTGVYHQQEGQWVDENSPTQPRRDGGKAHLMAEDLLRRTWPRDQFSVLRLAGIYGPGRIPRSGDIVAGRRIASAAGGYLNLIHVQDAATVVMAAWNQLSAARESAARPSSAHTGNRTAAPTPPPDIRLLAVADDCPIIRSDFYRKIAQLTGADAPQFATASDIPTLSFRSNSNKRVCNRRMKRALAIRLAFPSYGEGLEQALGNGGARRR